MSLVLPSNLRRGVRRLALTLLDTVIPPLCAGCGDELVPGRWICAPCRRRIRFAPDGPVCLLCRAAGDHRGDREAGLGCRDAGHAPFHARAACWMEPPLDACVHQLKYDGRAGLAVPLGRLLARRCPAPPSALVVPLPLHRTRRRHRGYNQAALIAAAAAAVWGLPVVEGALVRARATRVQARLDDAGRAANVREAFRVPDRRLVAGKRWIVLDDVATTGHTLAAAVGALIDAGAAGVHPAVLALA